ncbi:MAG: hypothetical protein JWP58_4185 [Hymenobacter sp.]|nr:hypothetical protein [Hymenobacter sp.]
MKQIKYSLLLLALLAGACKKDTTAAKPVAHFSAPASVGANVPLQVTNQSTDATDFLWTWGDGTTSTGATPSHAFDTYGNIRVRLAASSAEGTDTTSQVVQVTAGGAPASVLSSAVGNYRGRLYRNKYSADGSFTTTVRDTTMPLTTVINTSRVRLFNSEFDYLVGSYTTPRTWQGHAPQRKNVMFTNFRNVLQLEAPGDSIYCYIYSGGVVRADAIWTFYGKKQL